MNRLKLILVLFITTCYLQAAQAQDVIYSPYQKFDIHTGDLAVVGKIGNLLYTYRSGTDGYFLDAYNDSMELQATVVLDFFPKKIYDTRFISYADQIIVLYQALEGTRIEEYAALLDNTGRLKRSPIKIAEAKTGFFGATKKYLFSTVSEDKKTIVIYSADEKGTELNFDAKWIDRDLNILQRAHTAYKADNEITHGDAMLGNDGTFYMPVFTAVGSKSYADGLWLLSMPQAAKKFTVTELPLDKMYVGTGSYMKMDNVNNRIYTGGFYSDKKNGNYEGLLYANFDMASSTFTTRKLIPFDSRLQMATGERSAKRAFNDYQVRQLIIKNDGGFVLVAENFFVTTRTSYAPGFGYYSFYYPAMSTAIREYHYDDIFAISYNNEGTMDWYNFVRKDQYSQEDGGLFSSYAFLNTGGTLGFLFNDFNDRQSRIQLATIDNAGKVGTHSFNITGNDAPDWLPRSGKQVSSREVVVPCLRKKQICFSKIVF